MKNTNKQIEGTAFVFITNNPGFYTKPGLFVLEKEDRCKEK